VPRRFPTLGLIPDDPRELASVCDTTKFRWHSYMKWVQLWTFLLFLFGGFLILLVIGLLLFIAFGGTIGAIATGVSTLVDGSAVAWVRKQRQTSVAEEGKAFQLVIRQCRDRERDVKSVEQVEQVRSEAALVPSMPELPEEPTESQVPVEAHGEATRRAAEPPPRPSAEADGNVLHIRAVVASCVGLGAADHRDQRRQARRPPPTAHRSPHALMDFGTRDNPAAHDDRSTATLDARRHEPFERRGDAYDSALPA
jgi:hypothetical protein